MLDVTKVKKVVDCILNNCTVKEASIETGFSERTVQNYIKALNNPESNVYNPLLYEKIRTVQNETSRNRNRMGGKISTYSSNVSMEEKINMANIILANDFTLEAASIYFNIPTSTLYDYLLSIDNPKILAEIQALFIYHKENAFNHKTNNK